MVTIKQKAPILTLINTFEVEPDMCDELLASLIEATDRVMRHVDGFISASFHRSLDNKHITNYAQWTSKQAFDAMLNDPNAQVHMKAAAKLSISFSPILYHVVHVDERSQ